MKARVLGARLSSRSFLKIGAFAGLAILLAFFGHWGLAGDEHRSSLNPPLGMALGAHLNYEPVETTGELLERMNREIPTQSLVVRATVSGFERGRAYQTEPGLPSHTNVLVLDVAEVYEGKLTAGSESKIYLELDGTANADGDLEALRESTPLGTELLAYLWRMPADGIFPGVAQSHPNAGRPIGQPLHRPYPPGLFIEDRKRGSVIAPIEGVEFGGSQLDQFVPSGDIVLSSGTPIQM